MGPLFLVFRRLRALWLFFPALWQEILSLWQEVFALCLVVVNADLFTFHPTLDFSEDFSEEKHSISVTLNPEIRTFVNKPTVKRHKDKTSGQTYGASHKKPRSAQREQSGTCLMDDENRQAQAPCPKFYSVRSVGSMTTSTRLPSLRMRLRTKSFRSSEVTLLTVFS